MVLSSVYVMKYYHNDFEEYKTVFADFANVVPELSKDSHGRNSAIELRNNAKVILRGANEFEVTTIICRTETHSISFAESFMLGENVTTTFEAVGENDADTELLKNIFCNRFS